MNFGELVRMWRAARNLGLVELANRVGIDPTLLSRIERGQRLPPELPVLERLAKALGIDAASDDYRDMLAAAERGRNPELTYALGLLGVGSRVPEEGPPIFCGSLAEMVAKATEQAITTEATSITVKSADGAVQKFQVLPGQKSGKKGRRS
jgi:transcriptional regulator with XRE-family HTH domain